MAFDVADWSTIRERFTDWQARIPSRCGCGKKFAKLLRKHDPAFESRLDFFEWAWRIHLIVNEPLQDPHHARPTLAGAYAIWTDQLLATDAPREPYAVDVVVPFHSGDAALVAECVDALLAQIHVAAIIHLVADGCDFPIVPELPQICKYQTPGGWGPYRIANAISVNCNSEWFALQDADDVPFPERLSRQIATLIAADHEHISNAMRVGFAGELTDHIASRVAREKLLKPGKRWQLTPRGACVNSVRTMKLSTFRMLNGFADWFCSADWDFDNRLLFSRVKSLHSQTVVGIRRLHSESITNAPPLRNGSPARRKFSDWIGNRLDCLRRADPKDVAELAAELGELHNAPSLAKIFTR